MGKKGMRCLRDRLSIESWDGQLGQIRTYGWGRGVGPDQNKVGKERH